MAAKKRSHATSQRKRGRDEDSSTKDPTLSAASTANTSNNNAKTSYRTSKRQQSNRQEQKVSPGAYKQLLYGGSVLIVAIVAGVLWNTFDTYSTDPRILRFWAHSCRVVANNYCARFVRPVRRTLEAARPIRAGEIVAEIPRSLQIWDIDALRDDFVQSELFKARHEGTGNKLPSGAFLAAYLALQFHQLQESLRMKNTTTTKESSNAGSSLNPLRIEYLEALPTLEELSDHPLFWTLEELSELLGRTSLSFSIIVAYQTMVSSEYLALASASLAFQDTITEPNYRVARLWVMTRSFSPGPQGPQNELLQDEERVFFARHVGTDFQKGCHVMVPILDFLNHHPTPNVAYSYNTDKRAFVITAERTIPAGFEIYDSYGKFSDPHLFAKFGFVNGDGSGHTQASISLFHRMFGLEMGDEYSHISNDMDNPNLAALKRIQAAQQSGLVRYLQFDDGYIDCIVPPGSESADDSSLAWQLKELKFQHLARMANDASRWIVTVGPRHPKSLPVPSSEEVITETPPEMDVRKIRLNITPLVETCRLLSLVHTDYDGEAISILEQNFDTPDFVLERDNDALEYRAFMCLARLASTSLMNYKTGNVQEEMEKVAILNREAFGSRDWMAAHVRLGEMQTLQVLSGAAFGQLRQWQEQLPDPMPAEYTVRERSCPKEYVDPLLQPGKRQHRATM